MQGHQLVIFSLLIVNFIMSNWLHEIWVSFHENVHISPYYMCDLFCIFLVFLICAGMGLSVPIVVYHEQKKKESKKSQIFIKLNLKN